MERGIISILTTFFSLLLVFVPVQAENNSTILLDYPGATLKLDDQDFSYRSVDTISTTPGLHYLSLYLPPREGHWLPPIVKRPYELEENDTLVIDPERILYLHIRTTPEGAMALLKDHPAGKSPAAITILRPLDKTVRLKKEGYRSIEIDLEEITGQSDQLTLSLESIRGEEYYPHHAALRELDGQVSGWIPFTTLSYFVTSTALGFYYKGRADDFYEDYLKTSSLERMNNLYDRSGELDNRARILWITGQVALGASIYLLIQNFRSTLKERPIPVLNFGLSDKNRGNLYVTMSFGDAGP